MKFTCSIVALFAVVATVSYGVNVPNPGSILSSHAASGLIGKGKKAVKDNGCDPNVCFALDGSGSIDDDEWIKQKDFVQLVAAIISADPEGTYGAVQYGKGLKGITFRQTPDIDAFLDKVESAVQMKSDVTFMAPGIASCIRMLDRPQFDNEPKKIVIIGDGDDNFDSKWWHLKPKGIISDWKLKSNTNAVCGVAVNWWDVSNFEQIVGTGNVFKVKDWSELLTALEKLVIDICGWDQLQF